GIHRCRQTDDVSDRHVQAVDLSRSTRVFYQHGGAASGNANRHSYTGKSGCYDRDRGDRRRSIGRTSAGSSMTPKELMAYAIEKSRKGLRDSGNRPFAALIAKDGKIVAEALSRSRTSNDPTAHGEVVAIRMACEALNTRDLSGCEIYTSCEPCSLCVAAIHV